ncbi:hypothetical protein C1752_00787 [Acaryochloris thomasi RCC1774]|uniref:Uncharacterized protein n=1 Tax=Acaryochloris thomasi RCC1774 TaxID=1764569 RepID=A0A2W1JWW2_9CYAN|nr:hypothetical protein [Acaryochloris thomasi]PZD74652.1 hypothetical protein C1752_00787 [Acaryochloris thomasi RCC1774]
MKPILQYIEQRKKDFSQLPFFDYLRDDSISPRQRFAFAPCAAPFVMSFGELNKNVLRDESSDDPLQAIINQHTYEDDYHWVWFLEDLEKLGLNPDLSFREALAILWNEETVCAQRVTQELYHYTHQCSPAQKLVVIEVVESTGNVLLTASAKIIQSLEAKTHQRYRYFGSGHLEVDSAHTYSSDDVVPIIEELELTNEDRAEKLAIVDRIFEVFTAFTDEMLAYAKKHPVSIPVQQPIRLGTHLLEAGLITLEQLDLALLEQQSRHQRLGEILSGHGWVKQQTIEYLMSSVVSPEPHHRLVESPALARMN